MRTSGVLPLLGFLLLSCSHGGAECVADADCSEGQACDHKTLRCADVANVIAQDLRAAPDLAAPAPDLACPGAGGPCALCGCPSGQQCWDGACVDPKTSNLHCGGYGQKCMGKNLMCCDGGCVWLEKDTKNCGRCGNVCQGSMGYDPVCCPSTGAFPGECKPPRTICG